MTCVVVSDIRQLADDYDNDNDHGLQAAQRGLLIPLAL